MGTDAIKPHGTHWAIDLRQVSLQVGRIDLVQELSFGIRRGVICGLLAPSGGGKTSTLRLLTGVYVPTAGCIRVLGKEPQRFTLADRRRVGYMPQQFVLYPGLSVRHNLEFMAGVYGLAGRERRRRIDAVLEMVDLDAAAERQARRLSGGMQRRLQLAATLLHSPELLIVDEPTAGIDPILRAHFWEYFGRLREEGRTLVVSTQYVTEAERCDQVIMLRKGRVVADGTPAQIRRQALGPREGSIEGQPPSFEDVFLRVMEAAADEAPL